MDALFQTPIFQLNFVNAVRAYVSRFPQEDTVCRSFRTFVRNGARVDLDPIVSLETFRTAFATLASKAAPLEAMGLLDPEELTLALYIMLDDPLLEKFANNTKFGLIGSLIDKACVGDIEDAVKSCFPPALEPSAVDCDSSDDEVIIARYSPEFNDNESSAASVNTPKPTPPPSTSPLSNSPKSDKDSFPHPFLRQSTPYSNTHHVDDRTKGFQKYSTAHPKSVATSSNVCANDPCIFCKSPPHALKNCYTAAKRQNSTPGPSNSKRNQYTRSPSIHLQPPRSSARKSTLPEAPPLSAGNMGTVPIKHSPYTIRRVHLTDAIVKRGFLDICFPTDGIGHNFRCYTLNIGPNVGPANFDQNRYVPRRRFE
jgi:hypothetical protein